jgi:signal transduction histidine kinase/ActR/RegA family two-component response regulator
MDLRGGNFSIRGFAGSRRFLPASLRAFADSSPGRFIGVTALFVAISGALLSIIGMEFTALEPGARRVVMITLWQVFLALALLSGIAAWLLVRAHDRQRAAECETERNIAMLVAEIAAHTRTDGALAKARDAAEAANLAKSRYLIGVSHEIRSPLNAIYGYAQLLERAGMIDAAEAGRVIRSASEHLTNLVDGLLDISRIESGVLKLSREIVPLPALLEQLADMFRPQAQAKGIGFRYDAPANLPAFVRTDEKRLRQILINLLSNAVKYTAHGEAALTVRYRGLIAEFIVSDTGVGIAPHDLERIFEPFERGVGGSTNGQPGTGLGLAITRVLAQVMGGDVSVASEVGKGSAFTLRLMLAAPTEAPPATARLRPVSGYAGRRRTILVIDDDPAQLAVLQGLLRPLGFTVYAASNGIAGLDLAAHCDPDLVLLDIQMPGMTGWAVAAELRARFGERLKIVMVSANSHEFATGGDGNADHDGFVLKPVDLDALLDVVATRLGLVWDSAAPPAPVPALLFVPLAGATGQIAELMRLGKLGHVRGIETGLAALERDFPGSAALVSQLRQKVRDFDLKAYLKLLEPHG